MENYFISTTMGNYSYYISKNKYFPLKICISVLLIEYTEITWNNIYENVLFVSIFIKYMGCYLGVIEKINNDEFLIYIFTGGVLNSSKNIFTHSQHNYWFK